MGNKASKTNNSKSDSSKPPTQAAPSQNPKLVSVYAGFDPNLLKKCDCSAAGYYRKDLNKSSAKYEDKMKKKQPQSQQQSKN